MRRLLPFSLLALLSILALPAPGSAAAFLTEIDDLPLAPGLTEQVGGTLFDTPAGRIVEASATGDEAPAAITDFYAKALPDLGWKTQGSAYVRDGEILRIEIVTAKKPVSVRFSLKPQPAGAAGSSQGANNP